MQSGEVKLSHFHTRDSYLSCFVLLICQCKNHGAPTTTRAEGWATAITLKFKYLDSMQRSSAKDMLICDWRAKTWKSQSSFPLTVSKGRAVDLIFLICLAASKATIILKPGKGQQCCWARPECKARLGPQILMDSLFCTEDSLGGQLEDFSLCCDWQTWIKYHPAGLSDWWMAMDYKNVSGKWRFLIGRQDQKGRAFPANPELDNSRDLDSGLCVCVCVHVCMCLCVLARYALFKFGKDGS